MGRYQIIATLDIEVSQDGRRPTEVDRARRELAGVLEAAVNDLLLKDAGLREMLWKAAGGGDDIDGEMQFSVVDVHPN